ncbi:MAG: CinA family nicotinamide mononucleotide deamidase-related protein [Candidatus Cryptobacteroides sp.]
MIQASICTIGDEILIGQIVDTNSSHISQSLGSLGIRTTRMLSIGDDRNEIISNLENELKYNDIVIVTGGLGPTKDDITKAALAELSGAAGFKTDERQLEIVKSILARRGLDMLDINRAQADVPDSCEVIPNRLGTAPIMVFRFPQERFGHNATLYSLPGVPFEAVGALDDIMADIKAHYPLTDIYHKTIMTFGLAESALSKLIEPWEDSLPENMHLAYLPNPLTGVRLRLSVYGGNAAEHVSAVEEQLGRLKEIIGEYIYSEQDDTLQNCIGKMLKAAGKTVCAAESCTGGNISALFTSIPGCSEYYLGSVTSYANSVKENVLGVRHDTLEKYGAVSSQTAAEMAEGVRRLTGADFSVATTGIAGPGGGSAEKPVGLVWVGVSSAKGTETISFNYKNNRATNIQRFAAAALNFLREKIKRELND